VNVALQYLGILAVFSSVGNLLRERSDMRVLPRVSLSLVRAAGILLSSKADAPSPLWHNAIQPHEPSKTCPHQSRLRLKP
jgi:hypothetical protein